MTMNRSEYMGALVKFQRTGLKWALFHLVALALLVGILESAQLIAEVVAAAWDVAPDALWTEGLRRPFLTVGAGILVVSLFISLRAVTALEIHCQDCRKPVLSGSAQTSVAKHGTCPRCGARIWEDE
jgi:hypothetical protein